VITLFRLIFYLSCSMLKTLDLTRRLLLPSPSCYLSSPSSPPSGRFFPLFDTSRSALSPIYLPTSTFSLTICTNIAPRARQAGLHHSLPNQKNLTWKPYTSLSRNLLRLSKLDERVNRLSHGTEAILKTFTTKGPEGVPVTKHPIEDGAKWAVDSFAMETGSGGPVLLVTVHGEFEEMPAMGVRSFDRSFILSPAPPDSPFVLNFPSFRSNPSLICHRDLS
jgi:nuclear RNA export factor